MCAGDNLGRVPSAVMKRRGRWFSTVGELWPQSPPSAMDENKSTKTWSSWGGKVADLSKEKDQETFPQWAFIGFSLHRNTGKAHQ